APRRTRRRRCGTPRRRARARARGAPASRSRGVARTAGPSGLAGRASGSHLNHEGGAMATTQLRPLALGEILDASFALLRRHAGVFFGIAIVCQGLPTALSLFVQFAGGPQQQFGLYALSQVLTFVGYLLVTGASIRVVSQAYLGHEPSMGDALDFAVSKMGRSFSAGFASGILIGLGVIAGVAAAIFPPLMVPAVIGLGLISLFLYPFISCVFTLFYYDLRVRKEAFDLELLSQHLGVAAARA